MKNRNPRKKKTHFTELPSMITKKITEKKEKYLFKPKL